MTKLAELLTEIDEALDSTVYVKALRLLLSNFSRLDDNAILRERIGGVLAAVGRKKEAVEIWDLVARHYANAGYPARSLSAIKQMHALRPDSTVLLDHFATLYNIKSPYLDRAQQREELPPASDELDLTGREPQLGESELLDLAYERASEKKGLVDEPQSLPPLPLLSLLPKDALRRVIDYMEYEVFVEAQRLVKKGNQQNELVWTVTGDFTVDGETPYRLPSGTLLGLNGFGQSATPSTVTVFSRKSSELLRLPESAIRELDHELGDFRNRLSTLRRHALTEGLLVRHPMFTDLEDDERTELMDEFTGLRVSPEEILVAQDRPSPGIFLILEGAVDIIRNDDDWEITIDTLGAGDVFGEIGVVSDRPAMAGYVTSTSGHLLYVDSEDFGDLAGRFPGLAKFAVNLANERVQNVESTLSATDLAELEE
ncbi:MAG: cyclic nucleotide-binding domain-containing protein [Myxococcota bacterium]